jgi:translation initiation factor IF-2
MVEQQNMKVYELAKELGVDSISLLDKLNSLNIRVKNHMSDLGPEDVKVARTSLGKKTVVEAPKKAAPRVRKKAAEPGAEAPAKAPAAKAAKEKAAATPEAPAPEPTAGKASSPIIRRRLKSDGATETILPPQVSPTGKTLVTDSTQAALEAAHHQRAAEVAAEEAAATAQAEAAAQGEYVEEAPAPEASAPAPAAPESTAAPAQAPGQKPPIVLPPRPVAPRKSFLRIVEPTAPKGPNVVKAAPPAGPAPKITVRGTTTQDKDGFRVIKMTKENLDQMVEEEAAKKRGGGRVPEIRPEDVRFADYRKKEMVFLPKKKKIPLGKELKRTQVTQMKAAKRVVEMQDTITVANLADQLGVKGVDVVRKLMGMGQMVNVNASIDFDTATLVAAEYQYEVKNVAFKEEALLDTTSDAPEQLKGRPPVVTIMGHVDHGKTSLLDAIREANVAAGEAGGITQHIGAYSVEKDGRVITFIDTPGHEAFTVMRARGANVTDIVILVVAADDGVMPQTREALSHAKAAGVPIIVAMNKIDKPGANPEKIKQQLAELDLLAEDWGGQTMFVPVSALRKTNLDKLLEAILLQAEVADLKGNPQARASGTVLEARLEKGRGPVVSVLVKRGTLRVGDAIVSGPFAGKVKAMMDHKGQNVKEVGPGLAAEVLGFEGVPNAGEKFDAPESEADARVIAQNRIDKTRGAAVAATASTKVTLEDLFAKVQAGTVKELGIVLKADVFGSVEAIRDSLQKVGTDKVKVKVIHAATGGVTESDVLLAGASGAIIIGFNVRPETKARQLAEAEHVEIKSYQIIYELIDDVKKAMVGLLEKKKVEKFLGRAEVRQTFSVPKVGVIAGSAVIDGKIIRGANVRLLRESRVIYEGKMSSLKRFKDDAKEVAQGFECGIGLENYNDLKPGDLIEAYQIELVVPELGEASAPAGKA